MPACKPPCDSRVQDLRRLYGGGGLARRRGHFVYHGVERASAPRRQVVPCGRRISQHAEHFLGATQEVHGYAAAAGTEVYFVGRMLRRLQAHRRVHPLCSVRLGAFVALLPAVFDVPGGARFPSAADALNLRQRARWEALEDAVEKLDGQCCLRVIGLAYRACVSSPSCDASSATFV